MLEVIFYGQDAAGIWVGKRIKRKGGGCTSKPSHVLCDRGAPAPFSGSQEPCGGAAAATARLRWQRLSSPGAANCTALSMHHMKQDCASRCALWFNGEIITPLECSAPHGQAGPEVTSSGRLQPTGENHCLRKSPLRYHPPCRYALSIFAG